MSFVKKVNNKVAGMDSIAFLREVIINDDKLIEQAEVLQNNFSAAQQELIDREFDPRLSELININPDSNEYDLYTGYSFGLSVYLSTKKLMNTIGIGFNDNSGVDFKSLMFLNKDVQSILPELVRRILSSFHGAMETGTVNDLYMFLYDTLKKDIKNYPVYKYEAIGSSFASVDEYEEYIDQVTERITETLYKTKYSMGVLIYHDEESYNEAKVKIKELFDKYGIDITTLLDQVLPEQIISEPSQFLTLLQSYINHLVSTTEGGIPALTNEEVKIDIQESLRKIMLELGEKNAITKFNQTNGMVGNVFPTINICELIVMGLANLSYAISKDEVLSDSEFEVVVNLDGIAFDALSSKEREMGITLDHVHLHLLSSISLFVSDIVTNTLSLRSVDGSFQTMCSSVMNILTPIIQDIIKSYKEEVEGGANEPVEQ